MFHRNNGSSRPGGFRQNESSREHQGEINNRNNPLTRPRFSADGTFERPDYIASSQPKKRTRFVRAGEGQPHAEKVEPVFRPVTEGDARPKFSVDEPRRSGFNMGSSHHRPSFGVEGNPNGEQTRLAPKPKRNKNVYSKKKKQTYQVQQEDPTKPIRLNKYLANAGICSRREADDFIQAGVITVNGEVVDSLGTKILPTDKVMFHNQPVHREKKVYILLNKPKNTVTTTDDPQERHTVLDIVKNSCAERIYPVGRLDRNTTGVLLLTNDGDLASKLTHPKFGKKKVYAATLDRDLEEADVAVLNEGIELDGEKIKPDAIEFPKEDRIHVGLEIHSGQNRVVRRMFEKIGYKVVKLDRVSFAGLTKKKLGRGKFRFLTPKEIAMLQMGAFE